MKPEDKARLKIDELLDAAGWSVQDYQALNLGASLGVVVRNFALKAGFGFADYLLFVGRNAVGVFEAKPEGTTLRLLTVRLPVNGFSQSNSNYIDSLVFF